jgi:hypothetical protein
MSVETSIAMGALNDAVAGFYNMVTHQQADNV